MKILLQAIRSLLRKVENTAERALNFFGGDGIIKQEHLPDGYPYGETAEILPRTTIDIDPGDGGAVIQTPFTLVPGNEYTVTFNGEDYTCIAQKVETEPGTFLVAIGNVGAIMEGSDTGEPFVVAHLASEVGSLLHQIVVFDGSTSVTISIVGDRIVKMDARYLPDPILSSPNGTRFKITVDDSGTLSATAITE